jgi:hypothetical protein
MVGSSRMTNSLPVSRRRILARVAASPLIQTVAVPSLAQLPESPDPIVPLWREWERLHANALRLCEHWQEIESRLVRAVGFPQVIIPAADGAQSICAQFHSDINQAVVAGDCSQELSVALHAELAARRARWDAEAEALGFDEANRQELEAWRKEEAAVRAVFRTKAATLAGVEIKLALMIQLCSAFSDDPDFPLPQLLSTLADVKRLRSALDALRW